MRRRVVCICWTMGFNTGGWRGTLDVVLLTTAGSEDALLPAGNRRERLAALGQADALWCCARRSAADRGVWCGGSCGSDAAVWVIRRRWILAEGTKGWGFRGA